MKKKNYKDVVVKIKQIEQKKPRSSYCAGIYKTDMGTIKLTHLKKNYEKFYPVLCLGISF